MAALSSAVWFDFFLTEPYNRLTISDQADIETAALLVLVGIAVTEVALWGRRQQARRQSGAGLPRRRTRHGRDALGASVLATLNDDAT